MKYKDAIDKYFAQGESILIARYEGDVIVVSDLKSYEDILDILTTAIANVQDKIDYNSSNGMLH